MGWAEDLSLPFGASPIGAAGAIGSNLGSILYAKSLPDTSYIPADGRDWPFGQYPGVNIPPVLGAPYWQTDIAQSAPIQSRAFSDKTMSVIANSIFSTFDPVTG